MKQLRMIHEDILWGIPLKGATLAWLRVLTQVSDLQEEEAAGWTYHRSGAGCQAQLPRSGP